MLASLVKLDLLIYLLLAQFQLLPHFKVTFISQWVPVFSTFLLLSSQHLPCLLLRRDNERVWEHLRSTARLHSHILAVQLPSRTPYSGCTEFLLFSNLPSSLIWLGEDPSTSTTLLFTGYHFMNSNRTYSTELFHLITPALACLGHSNLCNRYCSTIHTQIK